MDAGARGRAWVALVALVAAGCSADEHDGGQAADASLSTRLRALEPAACPGGFRLADAEPPALAAARHFGQIAGVLGVNNSVGRAALGAGTRYCVTPTAVFYDPAWLVDRQLEGAAPRTAGHAALAYLAGLQLHVFGGPPFTRLPQDLAGARAAGCVLARAGLDRRTLSARAADLEALTGPRPDAAGWLQALEEGYASCR